VTQNAGARCWHFHIGLLGLNLDHRIALSDSIARVAHPPDNGPLAHCETALRHYNVYLHSLPKFLWKPLMLSCAAKQVTVWDPGGDVKQQHFSVTFLTFSVDKRTIR
jgi:hypothetical protein